MLCEFRLVGIFTKASLTRGTKASSVGRLGWKQNRKWLTDLLCASCNILLCPRSSHLLGLLILHNFSGNCITMNQLERYNWLLKMNFLKWKLFNKTFWVDKFHWKTYSMISSKLALGMGLLFPPGVDFLGIRSLPGLYRVRSGQAHTDVVHLPDSVQTLLSTSAMLLYKCCFTLCHVAFV